MSVTLRFTDPPRPAMPIRRRRTRIGRARDNDIVLSEPGVEPLHAILSFEDGVLELRDLSGRGVDVNRRRASSMALRGGDELRVGHQVMEVVFDEGAPQPVEETRPAQPSIDRAAPGALAVSVLGAAGRRERRLSDEALLLGSGRGCDLVLDDPTVSRVHARIERSGSGHVMRDLHSKNGLRVRGARLEAVALFAGLEVRLGAARVRVVRAHPAEGEGPFHGLVGQSPAMRALFGAIDRAARSGEPVLVEGETGTGKELVARALHALSPRAAGPYVTVNCGALPRELAESELFGHERGAFSGAIAQRRGLFEEASGGTLFLDEVAELSPELQAKLLRVLEVGELRRVGGEGVRRVDVRVVAAANRSLRALVDAGRFRLDLFHRIGVVELAVPPLRHRADDVALLARHFLEEARAGAERTFSPAALERLSRLEWPGNVRELRNVVRRSILRAESPVIDAADLALAAPVYAPVEPGAEGILGREALVELERRSLVLALRQCDGNKAAAARLLGISRSALFEKLRRYELR